MMFLDRVPSRPENHREVVKMLYELGHFHRVDSENFLVEECSWGDVCGLPCDHADVTDAVASWQSMRDGVKVDGDFGPRSARAADEEVRRCGCPDMMKRRNAASEWPAACQEDITTAYDLDDLRFTGEMSIRESWLWGLERWNEACGIHLSLIKSMSAAMDAAKIQAAAGSTSRGVLAWSYLPSNNCAEQLQQRYGRNVAWNYRLLREVVMHEIGHAIGLGHGGTAVMRPSVSGGLTEANAIDEPIRRQILTRYGPAKEVPPPPPVPPRNDDHGILKLGNREFDVTERTPTIV